MSRSDYSEKRYWVSSQNSPGTGTGTGLLSEEEKRQLLFDFNGSRVEFPVDKSIAYFIEDQAGKRPEVMAAITGDSQLTFGRLNESANRLAWYLRDLGVGEDQTVGLLLERSALMVESILAVWKVGGAYIPIETDYPAGRVLEIMKDSGSGVLLSSPGYAGPVIKASYGGSIINLDQKAEPLAGSTGLRNPSLEIRMNSLAYVIYTSGSTGKPKGAMAEHIGMMNHMWAKIRDLQLTTQSIVAQNASHTFDISVWQFFAALTVGGRIVIYSNQLIREPERLISRLTEDRVTILEVVPSYLSVMLEVITEKPGKLKFLNYLLVTGEEIKRHLVKRWFEKYPGIKMVNAYGPTEASDDITHHLMEKAPEAERIPIGKPLQNLNIYIVDEQNQLCPPGVKGEIWVSGIGVGRGYLNNPELTNKKFLRGGQGGSFFKKCPPGARKSSKVYRTGDLGRWLVDGTIEFFGRKDDQVKVRGFRIELGEIENKLIKFPGIKEVVVINREDKKENKYLCAYLVSQGELDTDEIKQYLSESLPHYMVPAYLVKLEQMPLTTNGKIDRGAFPAPDTDNRRLIPYISKEMLKKIVKDTEKRKRKVNFVENGMEIEQEKLSEDEIEQLLYSFNNTGATYPKDKTIHGLFQEQAVKTPANTSLMHEDQQVTYRELNEKSNQLARLLRVKGVKKNEIVGLMKERSIEMIIAMFAILKAGGAYLPIGPEYPGEKIMFMLNDCGVNIILLEKQEEPVTYASIQIFPDEQGRYTGSVSNLPPITSAKDLVHVLYTSGTTGKPKGVMIEHQGLINYLWWAAKQYVKNEKVHFPLYTSISFDLTGTSIFTPLLTGNTIVIYSEDDKELLIDKIIEENKVEIMKLTPSYLKLIRHKKIAPTSPQEGNGYYRMKRFILGGEELETQLARDVYKVFNGDIEIYNEYGPTETVIGSMIYRFDPEKDKGKTVPIGKPIDNTQIYILDPNLAPVRVGRIGELYISGDGVARGYLNRVELTAEKFCLRPPGGRFLKKLPPWNPPQKLLFNRSYQSYIYQTGDLARWLPDGNIEFLGRIDHQVKIRGYRIEPGEIEDQLLNYDNIQDAVVTAREDENGNPRLCANIVSQKRYIGSELREYLLKKLPSYMVPSYFVQMEKMPLTPNGKVDRKILAVMDIFNDTGIGYEALKDELEYKLAEIWAEVLGIEKTAVGKGADFFQLGGDSISALQVAIKARQAGIGLTSLQVFRHPGIEDLAAAVKSQGEQESPARGAGHFSLLQMDEKERGELTARHPGLSDAYPLTPIQQQMLSYTLLAPEPGATIMHLSWVMTGELDIPAFAKAWQAAALHHDILRTAFKNRRLKEPVQLLYETVTIPFRQLDCTGMSTEQQRQAIEDYKLNDKNQRFKLAQAPLMRLCLVILPDRWYRFICSYSALLLDNWSANIIVNEVFRYYDLYVNNKGALSPAETPRPFVDYVRWLLNHDPSEARGFWQRELKDFNAPVEPISQRTGGSAAVPDFTPGQREIRLLPREVTALTSLASQNHLTLGTLLQGAWVIALSRFTSQADILSGVLSYGRPEQVPGIDAMAGLFINTVPVRTKVPGVGDLITWLREFQDKQVQLRRFDYISIEDIAGGNRALLAKIQTAIYERTFVLVKTQGQEFLSGLSRENPIKINEYDDSLIMNVPLRVYAELLEDYIIIRLRYNRDSLASPCIEELAQHLETLLKQEIKQPGIRWEDLLKEGSKPPLNLEKPKE